MRLKDTRGYFVREALVSIVSIPAGRVSAVLEKPSGSDGWVDFRLRPTSRLPLTDGIRLVLVVRARTGAENRSRGSTEKQVSIRVSAKKQ